jgi:hypothetical protein
MNPERPVIHTWIILERTERGVKSSWMSLQGKKSIPRTFDTEKEAQLALITDHIAHLQEFLDGDRQFDELNFELEEWVAACDIHPDGSITTEDEGTIWSARS